MILPNNTLLQGGKYKITRFIASGGFGCTYEGAHTMLDTKVAIKEFFPKMFCNRDENTSHVTVATQGNRDLVAKLRKKFNEEAIAVFRMKHDNIVRVLDVFEENGTAYYVMEYVDGKSLNEIVKERGALPESEAVGYIRQVAEALKYVHSLNRLHLDIKPGNIMVDKNGKAILIDFGASKHYDDESGENTSTLMGVNTVGYAPLEQLNQSFTSFSPATDVYALGATLYKLLTTITPPSALGLVSEDEELIPLPKSICPNIRHAVSKAMELKRKRRFQSMDEFIDALGAKEASVNVLQRVNNTQVIAQEEEAEKTELDYIGEHDKSNFSAELLNACGGLESIEDNLIDEDNGLDDTDNNTHEICEEYKYVDLGLPSGIKWADRNLKANHALDHGGYYAWGECKEKDIYDKRGMIPSGSALSNIEGNLRYDASTSLGKGWRLPTRLEFQELLDYCTYEWTCINGVHGVRFRSRANGRTVFLPAGGFMDGKNNKALTLLGLYWTGSLYYIDERQAYSLRLDKNLNMVHPTFRVIRVS